MVKEIKFLKEIEKRECLYNHNLPDYNRRDKSEQAWSEVAQSRNMTVNECKEKWRNIRNAFQRSIKKSDKVKKPYYLSPYLQFVVPFTKAGQMEFAEELQMDELQMSHENGLEVQINSVKLESDEEENPFEGVFETGTANETDSGQYVGSSNVRVSPICRRRRRLARKNQETRPVFKRKKLATTRLHSNDALCLHNSSMRYFLLSLLPEFESMTGDQVRTFKIKVMMLIDSIKTNISEVRQNLGSSMETERLQKRLINLLLRNLQKNT